MEEDLVGIEVAKLAKQKGFNIRTIKGFDLIGLDINISNIYRKIRPEVPLNFNNHKAYSRPTQALLKKWLREIHNIQVYVHPYSLNQNHKMVGGIGFYEVVVDKAVTTWSGYNTYEEALEVGLLEALKLLPDKNMH